LSSISSPNLKLEVPSYRFLRGLFLLSSKGIFLVISDSVLGVSKGLISFPITGGVYRLLSFSFKDKKFNPSVFSGMPKVFQEDVLLSGVLLKLDLLTSSGVVVDGHLLALVNFGVSFSS